MDLQLATVSAVSRSSVRCYLFFADHCKEYKLGDWIIFWLWFFLIGAAAVANNWRHRIGTGKKFLRAETFGIEIGIGERLSGTKPSFCVNLVLGKRGKPKKGFFSSTYCVDKIKWLPTASTWLNEFLVCTLIVTNKVKFFQATEWISNKALRECLPTVSWLWLECIGTDY